MDALDLISREPLDHASAIPLYKQLKHRILQLVATGALDASEPLPAEEALRQAFGLSRATVRRCFKDLVDEGYVTRRAGVGTFLAEGGAASGMDTLYTRVSTSSSIERSGAEAGSRLLRVRKVEAEGGVARRLRVRRGTKVWEVNRLRLANAEPILHEVAYVPVRRCPHLGERDFDRSLYEYIAEESGSMPAVTDEVVEAVALDKREARLLGLAPGTPAMRIVATSYDAADEPFETSVGLARADRLRLTVRYGAEGARMRKDIG